MARTLVKRVCVLIRYNNGVNMQLVPDYKCALFALLGSHCMFLMYAIYWLIIIQVNSLHLNHQLTRSYVPHY